MRILDEIWIDFKFSPLSVKIASVVMLLIALGAVVLILSLFVGYLVPFLIFLGVLGVVACLAILLAYEPNKSEYRQAEEREDAAHRKEHPRPVFYGECIRCQVDRDYRAPRRYLGGR